MPQTLKGFRDFLPTQKRQRDFILSKIIPIFELFGFEPIETPTLEYAALLKGKYGEEADKLLYSFKDRGDREIALRYDQTVPTARVLSQYQNILPRFFRRYQIQNVFRADKPQNGRFREFTQCDIDIFGSNSTIADAEIIACTYFSFKNVGYPSVKLMINDRQILFKSLEKFSTNTVSVYSIIQTIDKLPKITKQQVIEELIAKGLDKANATNALQTVETATPSSNLSEIIKFAIELGVDKDDIVFTPTLARGLDYYTGMIFEVMLPDYAPGSAGGGGRYDKLIGVLGGIDMPAVGVAFGFDRMVDAAIQFNIINTSTSTSQVMITFFNNDLIGQSLQLATQLRKANIKTEVYPNIDKLDKQLKIASKIGIPFVTIIGPEEAEKKIVKLKNMITGEQRSLTISEVINNLAKS